MPCGVIFTTQIPRQCLAATVRRAVFPGPTHCVAHAILGVRHIDTHEPSFWKRHPFSAIEFAFWWGARQRGVPLTCVTSAYTTSSHALQRSVTSLRPTTSTPVHVGLLRLRIPQRRSAFFPERSSPFPRK